MTMARLGCGSLLATETVAHYHEQGFVVVRELKNELINHLDEIDEEVRSLGTRYFPNFDHRRQECVAALADNRHNFYVALRYMQKLARLSSSDLLRGCSEALGLQHPCVMNASNIRMDEPGDNPHQFHWHQDFTYLLGSTNALTYWIPMGRVDEEHGSVEVVPSSHRSGIVPYKITSEGALEKSSHMGPKDIELTSAPAKGTVPALDRGEILVFSQLLLHRTYPHATGPIRWTVQVRHSDLSDPVFQAHKCPFGDTTTIQRVPDYVATINRTASA